MKLTSRGIGLTAAGAVIAGCMLVVVLHQTRHSVKNSRAVSSELVLPTKTAPTTISTASKASTSKPPASTLPETARTSTEDLQAKLGSFLKAFYTIYPDDTANSRIERIAGLVPPKLLPVLRRSMGVSKGDQAKQVRKEQKTVTVQILWDELKVTAISGDEDTQKVVVPVVIWVATNSTPTKKYFQLETSSIWQLSDGRWEIQRFG
jgi:hypothetical protein